MTHASRDESMEGVEADGVFVVGRYTNDFPCGPRTAVVTRK